MSCNCSQNSSCNKTQQVGTSCSGTNSCCNGLVVPKFNVAKAQTICGYIDRIYDDQTGVGSAIFDSITTDTVAYNSSIVVTNPNVNCCTACTLTSNSIFSIGDCNTFTLTSLTPVTAITLSNVLVNGAPVKTLVQNTDGSYSATVSSSNYIPNTSCSNSSQGTASTFMLTGIGSPWIYSANSTLIGTVNTSGQACNFNLNFQNVVTTTATTTTSTFMVQSICVPSTKSTINFDIVGSIALINPTIAYDSTSSFAQVSSNVVITPSVEVQVIENTKVCIQAML